MKLYYAPGSCSLAPHIVAHEANLTVTLERVDMKTKRTASGDEYCAVNPKGYVPALQLRDGTLLTEVAVVLQYLGDEVPSARLLPPAGTLGRYRVQEWLHFVATELHKAWGPLFCRSTSDDRKQVTREQLSRRMQIVQAALEHNVHLTGDQFTVADAYLFTVLRWAKRTSVELPSSLEAYQQRIAARPAVRQALLTEGLLAPEEANHRGATGTASVAGSPRGR